MTNDIRIAAGRDPCLTLLGDAAVSANVMAVAGCPLRAEGRFFIASIIFKPDGMMSGYCKQHLHPGEDRFFSSGAGGPAYLDDLSAALAICAGTHYSDHAGKASAWGPLMQNYAAKHAFTVLLANHGGPTGGFEAAGKSAL